MAQLREHKRFTDFREMVFSNENESHADNGLLLAFLRDKGLQGMFHMFFGVDGKLPDSP